jgi:catechol 2,3-dioxygenase-like lactoylglutathione lyase family enzyme
MLHHLSIPVTNVERSGRFYDAALGALGYVRVWSDADAVGYGFAGGGDKFAIKSPLSPIQVPGPGFHIAFAATSTAAVDAFHAAALRQGGTDYGEPGPRPHYGPRYYAAFVLDPDGYRLEAVLNPPG